MIPAGNITYSDGGKHSAAVFEIPAQFRGNVSFTSTDRSGNTSAEFRDDKVIVVDDVSGVISVAYDNNDASYDTFYKAPRTAEITINEANFFAEAFGKNYDVSKDPSTEINEHLVITVTKEKNDGTLTTTVYKNEDLTSPFEKISEDTWRATLLFAEDADYSFKIEYTDFSGNVAEAYSDAFTVDNINPRIAVSYDNNSAKNGKYFAADREMTITVTEHNFNASDVSATVANAKATGSVADFAAYLKNSVSWISDGDVHTAKIHFTTEADYTFDIKYTDKSGRTNDAVDYGNSVAPKAFTLDKTAPTNPEIKIGDESVLARGAVAFERFYNNAVTVKYNVNCDISGLDNIMYQKVAQVSDYSENGVWTTYNNSGVTVYPNEKFIIYFRAEDKSGNVTIVNTVGIVVDDKAPVGEKNAPQIDIKPAEANENGFYNGDVAVSIGVVDPRYIGADSDVAGYYSGLNKITYQVRTTDTDAVKDGVLLDIENGLVAGGIYDSDDLVRSWNGSITIDSAEFNSNNVIVEITAVDNAGNVRVTTNEMVSEHISIDVTAPRIDISYDNNSADSGSFFKEDRTATVTVTERNFKPEDVLLSITNTDGVIPEISGWTRINGTGNLDDTKWTATISYTADGDYTFDIEYTDLADNKMSGVVYADGTVAETKFTIDKTIPTIEVTYDNNSAMNGNYYKADRTATVVITEHNFNAERVDITLKATDDGNDSTLPTVSGWSTDGDKHTATIIYNKDGLYTFDIAVKDIAGNDSADFAERTFYVDKTAPTLDITGVADRSANSGDIIPVISYSDTNYDDSQVKITLTGAIRKGVALDGSYTEQHNGKVFTFENFAKEKSIDDIYTLTAALTDKAGNSTEKTIMFSANRFGSTYGSSEATEKLNETYVQKAEDVVMTETNANELKNIKITLFKNSDTIILKEGEDYRIDVKGGNGQWYEYTYTVFAKNFADDGVYRLAFHSEDAAGNVAENTFDTKDKEISFGVDKTKPNIVVTNLESGKTYPLEGLTVSMSVNDNLLLESVTVYLDNYDKAYKSWNAEEIANILEGDDSFEFYVAGDSTGAHNVKIVCTDAAGNEQVEEITDFYVTTNLFVRYYNNKVLFFGTIGGVILVAGLVVALVVIKKKKQQA